MNTTGFHYQMTNTLNTGTQLIAQDCCYQKTSLMLPKERRDILFQFLKNKTSLNSFVYRDCFIIWDL